DRPCPLYRSNIRTDRLARLRWHVVSEPVTHRLVAGVCVEEDTAENQPFRALARHFRRSRHERTCTIFRTPAPVLDLLYSFGHGKPVTPEARLAGLPPEQRLVDLDRDHHALALPVECCSSCRSNTSAPLARRRSGDPPAAPLERSLMEPRDDHP